MHVLVMAKAPAAGRVKTRLCPPCTPERAAALAEAALRDTLDAALASAADRCVLALDGPAGSWVPAGVEVIPQRGDRLDERLAHAWADVGDGGVQIGMDTPQVTPALLDLGLAALDRHDAALGLADDGGWWAIGLRAPRLDVFLGVATSTARTGADQRRRLETLGLDVAALPRLRDVDTWPDACAVAAACPSSRFGQAVAAGE